MCRRSVTLNILQGYMGRVHDYHENSQPVYKAMIKFPTYTIHCIKLPISRRLILLQRCVRLLNSVLGDDHHL